MDSYSQQFNNQMGPAPEELDPRYIKRVQEYLKQQQQAPMSSTDGVNITITIQPNQAQAPQDPQSYITDRTQQIISGAMRNCQ